MSNSIPRRYPQLPGPPGERKVMCDYCGIDWYRSVCRRDAAKLLACPDCQPGRDTVTLDRLNSINSARVRGRRPPPDTW